VIIAAAHTDHLDRITVVSVAQEFVTLNEVHRWMYGSFSGQ
jgi:glutamyl/glutaminyl-tRNA synthetase